MSATARRRTYRAAAFTSVAAKRVPVVRRSASGGAVCGTQCAAAGEPKAAGSAGCRGLGELLGGWTGASGQGCSVGRRRCMGRGAGSSGRAAADATGWVAHLLDAVHVSRTHEAADACNHSKRYALSSWAMTEQARVQGCSGVWVEILGEGFGAGRSQGRGEGRGGGRGLWLVFCWRHVSPSPEPTFGHR